MIFISSLENIIKADDGCKQWHKHTKLMMNEYKHSRVGKLTEYPAAVALASCKARVTPRERKHHTYYLIK